MNARAYADLLDAFQKTTPVDAPESMSLARGEVGILGDRSLASPLADVGDDAWTEFVRQMAVARLDAVTPHNAVGMFEMGLRRLADLGIVSRRHLKRRKDPRSGKTLWTSVFLPPYSAERFLGSPWLQYRVLCASLRDYAERVVSGEIPLPEGMSLSGALAVLHRAGPQGLASWQKGNRQPATVRLCERTQGIF